MKELLLASTVLSGAFIFSSAANAAPCVANANGTFTVNNGNNQNGCSVSSVQNTIGNTSSGNVGFLIYSQRLNRVLTIENDFTTTVKGAVGISVYGTSPDFISTFDASGKTINLTLKNTDANSATPAGDNVPKGGVGVSHGGLLTIGTLNLTMENLPVIGNAFSSAEHYGVVTGSSVNAAEGTAFNGKRSSAIFDNLNIKMQSGAVGGFLGGGNPLLNGIRAIQGAGGGANSGNGSAGYVEVKGNLAIDIDAASNDAIGIYVSGSEQNRRVPEVRLNNSNIKIKSTSGRANAIRLGKTANVGTGEGRLTSLGHMEIDTTAAANSSAIAVIWQGAVLDANTDTSSTTIKAGREAISISGNFNQSNAQTDTMFNNLVASTTSTTANLVEVASNQQSYFLTVRGTDSLLTAASGGYLLNVGGTALAPSMTTFNFSEGTMLGLANKAAVSTLNLNLDKKAKWVLQEKTGSVPSTTAAFTKLDLKNASEVVAYGSGGAPAAFTLQGDINSIGGILNLSDDKTGDQLILQGQYMGSQGAVAHLDTFLGASGSASDMIVNDGGSISGQTLLRIKNTGTDPDGADTEPGHGIKLVNSMNGGTTTADAFMLDASAANAYQFNGKTVVGAGAYAYSLYKGPNIKSSSVADDYSDSEIADDWYLRSQLDKKDPVDPVDPVDPQFTQGVPVYEAYPQVLLALNGLPTLQ